MNEGAAAVLAAVVVDRPLKVTRHKQAVLAVCMAAAVVALVAFVIQRIWGKAESVLCALFGPAIHARFHQLVQEIHK